MDIKAMAANLEMEYGEFVELLGLYVEKSSSAIERLEYSVKSGNLQEVVEASHSIKGSSGNLGFMDMYEIAKEIEMNGRENNLDLDKNICVLKSVFDTLKNTIEQATEGKQL